MRAAVTATSSPTLAEVVVDFAEPIRQPAERTARPTPAALDEILARGAAAAREVAARTLADVYDRIGFLPRGDRDGPTGGMTERDIGVAIGLPEPYHAELQSWRERLGDPNAVNVPPHITLVPPTPLRSEDLPGIVEHLRGVAETEQAFRVHLRGTGTFRPVSPVVFVALAQGISDCERVQAAVRTGPLARSLRSRITRTSRWRTNCRSRRWTRPSTSWPTTRPSSTPGGSRCSNAGRTAPGDRSSISRSAFRSR